MHPEHLEAEAVSVFKELMVKQMEETRNDLNSPGQRMENTGVEKVEGSLSDGVKSVWAERVEKRTWRMSFLYCNGKRQKPIQIQRCHPWA